MHWNPPSPLSILLLIQQKYYNQWKRKGAFFPKQCGNTWGSYGNGKRPGWLDRGGGRVVHRFHRYFRGFVPACSFRV